MANIGSDLTKVYTDTSDIPLGQTYEAPNGKQYVFLKGVASTAANDVVTFNGSTFATTRTTTGAVGTVGVALAATVANTFGWYQIRGAATVSSATGSLADKPAYFTATAGRISTTAGAATVIFGMTTSAAEAANLQTVYLSNPVIVGSATV